VYLNEIYRHARDYPDTIAVVHNGNPVTYRQFAVFIDAVRAHLEQSQLTQGGLVATLTSNLYFDWVLLLALRSLGYDTVSATNWDVVESLDLRDLRAVICFAVQEHSLRDVIEKRPDLPVVTIPLPLHSKLKPGESPELIHGGRFGDHILFSSGTTGDFKKLRYNGEVTERCMSDPLSGPTARLIRREDVYHASSFGPWTKAGYMHPLICWYRGATVVFDQRPDWIKHFFDQPISAAMLLPPTMEQLVRDNPALPTGHPRMRLFTGGGFIGANLVRRVIRKFRCEFYVMYGSTEMRIALESLVKSEDDVVWLRPNLDTDIDICDEQGRSLECGQEGALRIRFSPNYPTEYIDDPEATGLHFRGGWFYPGDMAVRRKDGRIRILGRVDDVLNIGGAKHAIGPLEERTRKLLGVDELCMFIQQAADGGEILIVAIEGDRIPDRQQIDKVRREFARVSSVKFQPIGKFPRSDNGMMKVDRREVLRRALDSMELGKDRISATR